MSSKSPARDFSRLLAERTIKKEENHYKIRNFETSHEIVDELRAKLDLSLKHNAKLLDQNAALSELVNRLRAEVKALNEKLLMLTTSETNNITKVQIERTALMDELLIKQSTHQSELRKLLDEVARLHEEKNDLEILQNREMNKFKIQHQKNMSGCVQSIRSAHESAKDLYQTQIRKLKQTIANQQRELEQKTAQYTLQTHRLHDSVSNLQSEIKHLKRLHSLELQEVKNTLESQIHNQRRNMERDKQIDTSTHHLVLKRLKNELLEKNLQIDSQSKRMSNDANMHSLELQGLKREKEQLLSEISTASVFYSNKIALEKSKLKEISEQQIKNILDMNESFIGELRSQINNLKNLLDCKSSQIKKLLDQNNKSKRMFEEQLNLQAKINSELKTRLKTLERDNLEEMQAFKVKIARLVDADMKSLISYYQNELALLQTNNNDLSEINKENKQHLYKSLQQNDSIRKNFEVQISKQKARVQDLKIKLASLSLEHKEQVTSLATKMELTSQTLVREADQKQKSQAFFDQQKKKFHSMSNSKDREIADLLETMHRMKKMHQTELSVIRTEKKQLRDQIEGKEDEIIRIKQQFEEDLQRQQKKNKSQPTIEDEKEKQYLKELFDKNEKVETENIKLQKQVEHLLRENRSISGELGMKNGYIETLHLESSAAIEDEKGKLRKMMGNSEISLKEYFEDKLASRERDVSHLQTVLAGKQQDIRDLIVKYNGLQKRLETLLESQDKLRELDQKVKSLGLDNNLVKNMAQLFNRPSLKKNH